MKSLVRQCIVCFGLTWLAAATTFASSAVLTKDRAINELEEVVRHAPISGAASIALAGLLLLMGLISIRRRPTPRG